MVNNNSRRAKNLSSGFTITELVVVVAIIVTVVALSVPQMISSRRLLRSANMTREFTSQMRFARQAAMSQRRAITFQYDQTNGQLRLINHGDPRDPDASKRGLFGKAVIAATGYPDTANSRTERIVPLKIEGVDHSEFDYGLPMGVTVSTLADGTAPSALANGKINITFQPDGSVIDSNGVPANFALFMYNKKEPEKTAMAISVLGAAGRIKAWRYSSNANKFIE